MSQKSANKLICILGPTASGKTKLAIKIAHAINGEIISADSRQVYKGMDIGTGKDLTDFEINGEKIPYYLIDICEVGYKYNVYEYQRDFLKAYNDINNRNKPVILCGGTGMYIESVTKAYKLINVPLNPELRQGLNNFSDNQLIELLKLKKQTHNTSDFSTRKRLLRAIEIAEFYDRSESKTFEYPELNTLYIGINYPRYKIRELITQRLKVRIQNGMIEEVETLLAKGIRPEDLIFYGLEYKFVTQYLLKQITYDTLFNLLNTAIHQFAKRQMTWFRRMERNGETIHWIEGGKTLTAKLEDAMQIINRFM